MGLAGSFIYYLIMFMAFIAIALAGIVCGKKFRDSKEQKESK